MEGILVNQQNETNDEDYPIVIPCTVDSMTLTHLKDDPVKPLVLPKSAKPIIKAPAVLAETTIQIVLEANIPLNPPAVEIKRVVKDVFLTQCKLVPVKFSEEICPGIRTVTRGKLFVEGFIRKDIEYATASSNGFIRDQIATIPFSGFIDLKGDFNEGGDFITFPILGESSEKRSRFINPKNGDTPRLDKYFFENSVYYNEQPYCELISANFFELDFSPNLINMEEAFSVLREKIVVDINLKLLQVRQMRIDSLGDSGT